MRLFSHVSLLLLTASLAFGGMIPSANAQVPQPSTDTVLFDNITDPASATNANLPISNFKFIDESPRSMIGTKINLGNAPASALIGAKQIQLGLAHLPASGLPVQYANVQLQMKFYNNGSAAPGTDVFNDPVGNTLTFNVFDAIRAASPVETAGNQLLNRQGYLFRVDLPVSVRFKDGNNIGIAFRFLGDRGDGAGLRISDELSLVMRQGAPFKVGTSDFLTPSLGYLRDGADGLAPRNDFNFDQSDGASFAGQTNVGVAMRLYGVVVPEANTASLLLLAGSGIGATVLVRRRRA